MYTSWNPYYQTFKYSSKKINLPYKYYEIIYILNSAIAVRWRFLSKKPKYIINSNLSKFLESFPSMADRKWHQTSQDIAIFHSLFNFQPFPLAYSALLLPCRKNLRAQFKMHFWDRPIISPQRSASSFFLSTNVIGFTFCVVENFASMPDAITYTITWTRVGGAIGLCAWKV